MTIRKGVIEKIDNNTSLMQTAQVHGMEGELSDGVERYQNYGYSSHPRPIDTDGKGSEVIIADLGGSSLKTIIATDDRRYRPKLALPGDVQLYTYMDNPDVWAQFSTHRITLKTNISGVETDYAIISKCNETKIEQHSDGTVTVLNPNGSIVISPDGTITTTNTATTITQLPSGTIDMTATTVNIDATTTNIDATTTNITSATNITGATTIVGNTAITGTFLVNGKNVSDTHTHGGVTTGSGSTAVVN